MEEERKYYLDNIKTILILGLFVAHTCEMYHLKEGFYVEGTGTLVPTLVYNFLRSWYMSVLFFIAGLTTMYSLRKRTIKEYYTERCKRLLVPFVVGLLLWVPIQSYYTLKNHYDFDGNAIAVYKHFFTTYTDGFYGYDGGFTPSHLWFLIYLMIISLISYPVIKYKKNNFQKKLLDVSWKSFAAFTLIIYVVAYGTSDESIGKFIAFFVVGLLLYDNEGLYEFTFKNWKVLGLVGLATNICMAYTFIKMHDMNIWTFEYAWMRLVWAISCTTAVFGVIGIGQRFLDKTTALFKFLSERSFAIYYIHMTVVIMVGYYVVTYVSCGVALQIGMIMGISAVVTFALVEVAKMMIGLNGMLGLRGKNTFGGAFGIKKKLKDNEYIVTWLGLILTMISVFFLDNKVNEIKNYYNNNINNRISSGLYEEDIEVSENIIVGDNNSDISINVDKSVNSDVVSMLYMGESGDYFEDALKYAECYFSVGEYKMAFNIYYMLDSEKTDNTYEMAVVKNNLGYLYANGLGCDSNHARAIELYDEAILLGCERAMSNKVALALKERYVERVEFLVEALNEDNEFVNAFILSNYNSSLTYTEEEYLQIFKSATNDEMKQYIDEYLYEEQYVGMEKFAVAPIADGLNRYEAVGDYSWYNAEQGTAGTVFVYKHYVRCCKNIDLLQEGIIYNFEKKLIIEDTKPPAMLGRIV